jgi:UDP-glucose 4-epimerase
VLLKGHTASPVDAVVHLEVKQHVPRPTPADVAEFAAVNVGGTREWLEWAAGQGVSRFVFLSSIKAVAPGSGPMPEDSPAEHASPYGRSKAEAEEAVRAWAAAIPGRTAVILRPAPVYGPGNEANLAAFVRQILAGKPCLIGRGETRKSVVSRTNLCAAIAFAAEKPGLGCHVFNVSDVGTLTMAGLAAMIADLGHAPPPRRIPAWLAAAVAPFGDAIEALTGRDFPLTSARLRAIRETTVFPCDTLLAAGFRHPQTTGEGIAEMVAWARGK